MQTGKILPRLLLPLAVAALLFGMWAGLLRMGWRWPLLRTSLPVSHGPLMVSGFFGTLILLERAVAIKRYWAYAGVLFSGLGAFLILIGVQGATGPVLLNLGSLWMVLVFAYILHQHRTLYTLTMAAGAACWLIGNLLWLSGSPVYKLVWWWLGFLVLTIAGERLELSRVMRLDRMAQQIFLLACGIQTVGFIILSVWYDLGFRIIGAGLLVLAAWLLRYDVTRRTVRTSGLPRYIAFCLLAGYFWLAFAGLMMLGIGGQVAGFYYDAILHAVFLGFVFSMVFGHAPILLPAVLHQSMIYHPLLYLPWVLLHLSLLLRVAADFAVQPFARQVAGLLNSIAILFFFGVLIFTRMSASRSDGGPV